jgi:hypothetical protein
MFSVKDTPYWQDSLGLALRFKTQEPLNRTGCLALLLCLVRWPDSVNYWPQVVQTAHSGLQRRTPILSDVNILACERLHSHANLAAMYRGTSFITERLLIGHCSRAPRS